MRPNQSKVKGYYHSANQNLYAQVNEDTATRLNKINVAASPLGDLFIYFNLIDKLPGICLVASQMHYLLAPF